MKCEGSKKLLVCKAVDTKFQLSVSYKVPSLKENSVFIVILS